ncbi:MAG: TetR/AcrR family transcriptional regulator [Planctomycetes bacterium]|nr:TetR/AcrR family transcriptional regulator [Planctomycetota bacterium]
MPPNPTAVAETRSRIHASALELFTKRGFHGTGMRQIARGAEVSLGNLYNHHKTKKALFAALLEEYEAEYTAPDTPLAKALASFKDLSDLERIGEASRAMIRRFSPYIRLIYVDLVELEGGHIRRLFGGMRQRYEEQLGERLQKLRDEGLLGDVDPITGLMTATISYFYLFNIQQIFGVTKLYGVSDKQAIHDIAEIFRWGLEPR